MTCRAEPSERHDEEAMRAVLAIAGTLISLVGAVLAAGGYLSMHGSAYHIFAGFGLIASGMLLAKRHPAGAWTYMAVFAGTLVFSLQNIGLGTPLAGRLAGPSILIAIFALLAPLLWRWTWRRSALLSSALLLGTFAIAAASIPGGPLAPAMAATSHFIDDQAKGLL
jgi:glucose dehydrogenase